MTDQSSVDRRMLLSGTALFSTLNAQDLDRLLTLAQTEFWEYNQVVFNQGEVGNKMYIIAQGKVRVSIFLPGGKEVVLGTLGSGEGFGEIALFDRKTRSATVTTVEPSILLVIEHNAFIGLLWDNPKIAIELLAILAKRLRATDELFKDTLTVDLPSRLAKQLVRLAGAYGQHTRRGIRISVPFSTADLAEMTALPLSNISAQMSTWQEQGLIHVRNDYITIFEPDEFTLLV